MLLHKFLNILNNWFGLFCHLNPRNSYPNNYAPQLKQDEIFDFIVVGGGTAGCVLAGRLTENPAWKVLLIEAGDYPTTFTEVPSTLTALISSDLDYKYKLATTDNECYAYKENHCTLTAGKVLGGTSSINGLLYLRDKKDNYNEWSKMGNDGWDWENVSKYFQKAENFPDHEGYGSQGPLLLDKLKSVNQVTPILLKSFQELGYSPYKTEEEYGLYELVTNVRNGTRCSTAKAYIAKNKKRPNLYIALGTKATKIIFNNNMAVGVEVTRTVGAPVTLRASKEIIISAGAISSPQLLMLSGIGPEEHLTNLNIPVIKNLQVGKNYHDHLGLYIMTNIKLKSQLKNYMIDFIKYCKKRTGASFTSENDINIMFSTRNNLYGDIHLQFSHIPKIIEKNIMEAVAVSTLIINKNVARRIADYIAKSDLILYRIFLGSPKFRGEILLKSNDPNDEPIIIPNLLSNEDDVKALIASIHEVHKLLNTSAMKAAKADFLDLGLENCGSADFTSEKYLRCYIRNIAHPFRHSVGTCKMGNSSDTNAVVDERLRVRGIEKLRVADGSIMPTIVSKGTHAPIIMIGEKAADMIKEDYD